MQLKLYASVQKHHRRIFSKVCKNILVLLGTVAWHMGGGGGGSWFPPQNPVKVILMGG